MKDTVAKSASHEALRRKAESLMDSPDFPPANTAKDALRSLLHELDVHHVELELQNTELSAKESELAALYEKYYTLYDLAPVGYLTCSASNLILEANLTLAAMLGTDKQTLLGRPFTSFIVREDQDIFYLHRRQILAQGQHLTCELRLQRAENAGSFWAQLQLTLLPSSGGAAEKELFIGVNDIAQLKETETELLCAQHSLEARIAERSRQLDVAHTRLLHAEKLAASGRLAASIAHEVNNPLCGIYTVLETVARTELPAEIVALVQMALSECNRIKRLILNLQAFNRPSSGLKAPIDLNATVTMMLQLCSKACQKAGITIHTALADALPPVTAVSDQIKQVLLNLFQNAMDAMADAGGTLTVRTERADRCIALHITDTGVGISDADLPYIFEPFISSKPEVKGTGLGLSISYGIIKGHGGDIKVTTKAGEGSTFTLTFPLDGEADAHHKNSPSR